VVLAYREAGMLLSYLRDSDQPAFDRMMNAILDGRTFVQAVTIGYHDDVRSLWKAFIRSNSDQNDLVEPFATDPRRLTLPAVAVRDSSTLSNRPAIGLVADGQRRAWHRLARRVSCPSVSCRSCCAPRFCESCQETTYAVQKNLPIRSPRRPGLAATSECR